MEEKQNNSVFQPPIETVEPKPIRENQTSLLSNIQENPQPNTETQNTILPISSPNVEKPIVTMNVNSFPETTVLNNNSPNNQSTKINISPNTMVEMKNMNKKEQETQSGGIMDLREHIMKILS